MEPEGIYVNMCIKRHKFLHQLSFPEAKYGDKRKLLLKWKFAYSSTWPRTNIPRRSNAERDIEAVTTFAV